MQFVVQQSVIPRWRLSRHIRGPRATRGFTLIELLVVMAIIGILIGLLMPALGAVREASRRSQCGNNLHQIGVALQAYHESRQRFPVGASWDGTTFGYGVSWWVKLLPHLDESSIHDRLDRKSPNCGNALVHAQNGLLVHEYTIEMMLCPSSLVPSYSTVNSFKIMTPSYVGISGATSHNGFSESRVNTCCHPSNSGEISGGGLLVPNTAIQFAHVLDGASQTLLVSETSDHLIDASGIQQRVDASFNLGWIIGTKSGGTPPNYGDSFKSRCWNITTIRYAINTREYELAGIDDNHEPNNPLLSAHRSGVNALFVDGSVRFLNEDLDVTTLKQLATRDDGASVDLLSN